MHYWSNIISNNGWVGNLEKKAGPRPGGNDNEKDHLSPVHGKKWSTQQGCGHGQLGCP